MLRYNEETLTIEIPFDEYKELLMIKGKYEELKLLYNFIPNKNSGTITYRNPFPEHVYQLTSEQDTNTKREK